MALTIDEIRFYGPAGKEVDADAICLGFSLIPRTPYTRLVFFFAYHSGIVC